MRQSKGKNKHPSLKGLQQFVVDRGTEHCAFMLAVFDKAFDDNRFSFKYQIKGSAPFPGVFDAKKNKIVMCKFIGKKNASKKCNFECHCFQ